MTFKRLSLEEVLSLVTPKGVEVSDWTLLPTGRHGYRQGLVRGHVRVYHDGNEGMGIHVAASGQGVRQLEAEGVITAWEGPQGFAAALLAQGAQISRIDIAFDDRQGYLTPERIEDACTSGRCVSRFHTSDPRAFINLKDGSRAGWSMTFGAASSRVRVRFYDKAAEQAGKGVTVEGHWLRCEVQARDKRGQWVLNALAVEGCDAVTGLLASYIQFKEAGDGDTNRTRWAVCDWWTAFLGDCEKRTCTVSTVVRTVEQAARWFVRQVAPTFALLRFSAQHGADWLDEVFADGAERLRDWQLAALLPPTAQAGAVT